MRPCLPDPVVAGLKVGITEQRFGDWCESFRYIPALQERIRMIDSGATVELLTYNHKFLRFFMAPSATRESLKMCRPVVALDGTFLIHAQKATLLYANAMDGNQQIIPIAWALVESETKDTWTWFCRLFDKHCSDWKGRDDAAIISDRDKGLIPAVKEVFPEKVKHMQQNVKRFGKTSADMLWRLLTARSLDKYNELKGRQQRPAHPQHRRPLLRLAHPLHLHHPQRPTHPLHRHPLLRLAHPLPCIIRSALPIRCTVTHFCDPPIRSAFIIHSAEPIRRAMAFCSPSPGHYCRAIRITVTLHSVRPIHSTSRTTNCGTNPPATTNRGTSP
ncbi:unnamed protein product [Closterium sp. Naga37s-1]|nr:unnamed protein product [Closterium sp. Naga37s-1]